MGRSMVAFASLIPFSLVASAIGCAHRPPPRVAQVPVEKLDLDLDSEEPRIAPPLSSAANGRPRGSKFENVVVSEEALLDGAPRDGVYYERADGKVVLFDDARVEIRGSEWFLLLDSQRTRVRITFGSGTNPRRTRRIHAGLGAGDVWIQMPRARVDPYGMEADKDVKTSRPRTAYTLALDVWMPQAMGRIGQCSLRFALYVEPPVEETDPGYPRFASGTLSRIPCSLMPEYPVPAHGPHL